MGKKLGKKRKHDGIIKNRNWELQFQFPDEILQVIISKVSFPHLQNCRFVCKSWNNLVSTCKFGPPDLFFVSISTSQFSFAPTPPSTNFHCVDLDPKHLEGISSLASISNFHPKYLEQGIYNNNNYNSFHSILIINSCTGLLAMDQIIEIRPGSNYLSLPSIFNPMTNECIKLPPPLCRIQTYRYGLGFSPKTKEYKMVRTSRPLDDSATIVEIFAFAATTPQWTHAGSIPSLFLNYNAIYFNGGLYWKGYTKYHDYNTHVIYRFDIETEKWTRIPSPPSAQTVEGLGVMNGFLWLTNHTIDSLVKMNVKCHAWKMEDDFSWTKLFVFSEPKKLYRPKQSPYNPDGFKLQLLKMYGDGQILCLYSAINLILYDPNTRKKKILTRQGVPIRKHLSIHPIHSLHFNSLYNILAGNS